MAQTLIAGIEIAEHSGPESAIGRGPTAVVAFVGRTLRGPVNQPLAVSSFSEYQAIFGGLWQPSTLGYAVEQFFENGGRQALIVRVVNGAKPPTLTLRAGAQTMVLRALNPGTREYLRAAVDYDGIGEHEPDRFNLVVQRVRAPRSEHVEDQEIFRRLSVDPRSSRPLAEALAESRLVRLGGPVPTRRPDSTDLAYVDSNPDGDDGAPLTDYDLIGSATAGAGLFALAAAPPFNFLCLPPLERATDVGLSTLLVAAKFCRDRHAMLIVDPPLAWQSTARALQGLREWELRSDNALMYYPRLLAYDRLRGRFEQFASCGAIAGMLARHDEQCPVWSPMRSDEPLLRPSLRAACAVEGIDRNRLLQLGVNVLQPTCRVGGTLPANALTLAAGNNGAADWRFLAARRLALFIVSNIERDTRWVVFESNTPALRRKVTEQIEVFFSALELEGAFPGHSAGESWFVVCDERYNGPDEVRTGTVNVLFGFAAHRPGEYHAYLLRHTPARSELRPVSVNRLETGGRRLDEEMTGSFPVLRIG